jgi:hypothetical protein
MMNMDYRELSVDWDIIDIWSFVMWCRRKPDPLLETQVTVVVYFCHQNQNAENIGNFMTLLKPHNIGTHLKGIETSFQVVPLFFKSFYFWVSYITFCNVLKIHSVLKGLIHNASCFISN